MTRQWHPSGPKKRTQIGTPPAAKLVPSAKSLQNQRIKDRSACRFSGCVKNADASRGSSRGSGRLNRLLSDRRHPSAAVRNGTRRFSGPGRRRPLPDDKASPRDGIGDIAALGGLMPRPSAGNTAGRRSHRCCSDHAPIKDRTGGPARLLPRGSPCRGCKGFRQLIGLVTVRLVIGSSQPPVNFASSNGRRRTGRRICLNVNTSRHGCP
jgi:hypothetical protein